MLRNGNSWLKIGVSRAAHTQYAYGSTPPPGYITDRGLVVGISVTLLIESVVGIVNPKMKIRFVNPKIK